MRIEIDAALVTESFSAIKKVNFDARPKKSNISKTKTDNMPFSCLFHANDYIQTNIRRIY